MNICSGEIVLANELALKNCHQPCIELNFAQNRNFWMIDDLLFVKSQIIRSGLWSRSFPNQITSFQKFLMFANDSILAKWRIYSAASLIFYVEMRQATLRRFWPLPSHQWTSGLGRAMQGHGPCIFLKESDDESIIEYYWLFLLSSYYWGESGFVIRVISVSVISQERNEASSQFVDYRVFSKKFSIGLP